MAADPHRPDHLINPLINAYRPETPMSTADDLVARFRAEADQDAAFESAIRLVRSTTHEVERLEDQRGELLDELDRLRQDMAEMQDELDELRRLLGLSPAPLRA